MRRSSTSTACRAILIIVARGLCACNGAPEAGLEYDPEVKAITPGYAVDYSVRWNNEGWALDTPDCLNYRGTCDQQTFTLQVECGAVSCALLDKVGGAPLGESTVVHGEAHLAIKPLTPGTLAPRFLLQHSATGEKVVLEAQPIRVLPPQAISARCRYRDANSDSDEEWSRCDERVPLHRTTPEANSGTQLVIAFRLTAADGTVLLTGATPTVDGQPVGPEMPWSCGSHAGLLNLFPDDGGTSVACGMRTQEPMRSTVALTVDSLVASVTVEVQD